MAQRRLIKGYSAASIGKNIAYEMKKHDEMSQAQAVAIALSTAREAARAAGKTSKVRQLTARRSK